MQSPLEIINRTDAELPDSIAAQLRDKAAKLEIYYHPIMSCKVTVDAPNRHHRKGSYSVGIDIHLAGAEFLVTHHQSSDLAVAVRDAFDAARRRLEDHARHQRGDIKHHEERSPSG